MGSIDFKICGNISPFTVTLLDNNKNNLKSISVPVSGICTTISGLANARNYYLCVVDNSANNRISGIIYVPDITTTVAPTTTTVAPTTTTIIPLEIYDVNVTQITTTVAPTTAQPTTTELPAIIVSLYLERTDASQDISGVLRLKKDNNTIIEEIKYDDNQPGGYSGSASEIFRVPAGRYFVDFGGLTVHCYGNDYPYCYVCYCDANSSNDFVVSSATDYFTASSTKAEHFCAYIGPLTDL